MIDMLPQGQREVNKKDKFIFWWSLYLTVRTALRASRSCCCNGPGMQKHGMSCRVALG